MEKRDSLYIPHGLKTRNEIFDGYGKEEAFLTFLVILVLGFIDAIIYLFSKNTTFCVVFFLSSAAGTVMMLAKDSINNISVIDQAKFMIKFSRTQKTYKYKYYQEWL